MSKRFKKVLFIVNPASGQDEPVLSYINRAFLNKKTDWELKITRKKGDAKTFAAGALKSDIDLVAVYGGDGTVMEVAQALYNKKMPMAIVAGGTSNVMAKELEIPVDTVAALELIASGNYHLQEIDMGVVNKIPFLIRVSTGSLANMIKDAGRPMKDKLGQAAYGVSTLKQVRDYPINRYSLELDGEKFEEDGVALLIANTGHTGLPYMSFTHPNSPFDGLLDVLLIKRFDLAAFKDIAKVLMTERKINDSIAHWLAKDIKVKIDPPTTVFCDDAPLTSAKLSAQIMPKSITILVPHDKKVSN
jgi:diacylglycerol kinase (ATP)